MDGVVTFLFTDLVGSTQLLDRLGDDVAEDLRRSHFALLRRAVAGAGGTEVKSLGDGIMVSFASPVAALECAVAMQTAVAEDNRKQPGRVLQIRVGIHAGEPLRDGDDFHGSAVVVARRLCDHAQGGQILASEIVTGLVGRRGVFRFRPVGRLVLKGLSEPTPTVMLDWEPTRPEAPRPPRAGPDRKEPPGLTLAPARVLVGREEEVDRFRYVLSETAEGRGQIAFVVGPMGMGKTRLAEEALSLAHQQGFRVLVGRTPGAGSGLAYAPLLSAFGTVLRSREPWDRAALVGDLLHLGRLWPELGLSAPAPVGEADLERTLLFEAVARLLERLAGESPVALFVDDLHWADAPSLALLGYLAPNVAGLPVLLLGAYRPEGIAESRVLRQFVANTQRLGFTTEIPLQGLDREEVAALAAGILGDAPPESLVELSARAAGTPLFVEALVRGLLDAGTLVRSDTGWTLAGAGPGTLPRSVRDLVMDRLELLEPDERSTLELIAHGAQGLSHALLERASGIDPDELLAVIGRLVAAGLLVQEVAGTEVLYRLSHPLIEEVAGSELPAVTSRRIHARLAQGAERVGPRDLDRLAYHYSRAGGEVDGDRVLEVLLEAGERAQGLAAHDEAARHFGAALSLIRDGRRPELLPEVLERLGQSLDPVGQTAAAIGAWNEAAAERQRQGDLLGVARLRRRLGIAARSVGDADSAREHLLAGIEALHDLPPSEELVDLHHARLLVDSPLFDPDRAAGTVAELSRLAEALGSPRCVMESLSGQGMLHLALGNYDLARAKAEESLSIAEQTGDWNLVQRAHRDLAWVTWFVADYGAGHRHAAAQLELDRRLGAPAQEPLSRIQFVLYDLYTVPLAEVVKRAEAAAAEARRHGQGRNVALVLGTLAMAHALRGALDSADECLNEARSGMRDVGVLGGDRMFHLIHMPEATLALERDDAAGALVAARRLRNPGGRVLAGAAQVLLGDLEAARATARKMAGNNPEGSYAVALADRVFGLVEQSAGNADAAREHLERSAAALDDLRLPLEAAISLFHAGTVESLSRALTTFDDLGAARYADRSRRGLRALGVRPPTRRSGRDEGQQLSRRELEVARLVAEGLSNAEIATRLVISSRTVASHLDHIYSRLGISSRVALTRWLADLDQPSGDGG